MFGVPESWRAVPVGVRRAKFKDAGRGVPPRDPAVARGLRDWAGWVEGWAPKMLAFLAVLACVILAATAATSPRLLLHGISLPFTAVNVGLQLRLARRVRALLGG